ncbi:MAG TPA: hypothetical protein VF316_22420 [Polyangiaceae bacterium]
MRALRAVALGALLAVSACSHTVYRAKFVKAADPGALDLEAPFLKCHLKDGGVVVLRDFHLDTDTGLVRGVGVAYDANRKIIGEEAARVVALADVVLYETNEPRSVSQAGYIAPMIVVTAASLGMTAYCIGNPKACFGSCPTFFADDGHGLAMQAEGFSSSIAKSLEATDVDAMWTAKISSRTLDVLMTNDALETHAVRSVRVLYAPRPAGTRVLRAGARYVLAKRLVAPLEARTDAGVDVADLVRDTDGREYKSEASPTNLAEKETLTLHFPETHGRRGILVVGRNSLLETFVFYQMLAYMGRRAGEHFAYLERFGKEPFDGVGRLLGDVEVAARVGDTWTSVGAYAEVGPIAREAQLVLLPEGAGDDVRLTMAKGNFRLEQLALAELGDDVVPTAVEPSAVLRDGQPDERAKAALLDADRYLVTLPKDAYTLRFELPGTEGELFLESRGYYTEWIRHEWLREEDDVEAMRILLRPEDALRVLAPRYKALEGDMDRVFWQSRVARH